LQAADPQALASTPSAACTAACTSEAETDNAGTTDAGHQGRGEGADQDQGGAPSGSLAKLAAALLTLSPADRERLAALLAKE
jgi:hypothetical protein